MALEETIQDMAGGNFPTCHHFAKGIYVRETLLPANSVCVGKIHRHSTVNIITMGLVKAFNPEQPDLDKFMNAPYTFVSPGGSKRCVYAAQDSIWCTVHATESTDLEDIEEEFIIKDYNQLSAEEKVAIGAQT